jgi:hypothetical protein
VSNLDTWKASGHFDVTLPSGQAVTLRLPDTTDCILAGGIPLEVMSHLETQVDDYTPTNEEVEVSRRFHQEMVRAAVVAVDGEAVELSMADVEGLPQDDSREIFAYAKRAKPAPKAD